MQVALVGLGGVQVMGLGDVQVALVGLGGVQVAVQGHGSRGRAGRPCRPWGHAGRRSRS